MIRIRRHAPRRSLLWQVKAWGRVWLYLAAFSLVSVPWVVASAKGQAGQRGLELGRSLDKMSATVDGANAVQINGQTMFVAVTETDRSVEETLNFFERGCQAMNVGFDRLGEKLSEAKRDELADKLGVPSLSSLGVISERTGEGEQLEGVVICLAANETRRGIPLTDRLQSFLDTGDLAEVGELRYIYARKASEGNGTHLRVLWTEGSFDFFHMFNGDGEDAPGTDPSGAPRPPRASRLIDASVQGQPYNLWLYESNLPVDDVLAYYDAEMKPPWKVNQLVTNETEGARHFMNAAGNDVIIYSEPQKGGGSFINIVEMALGNEHLKGPTNSPAFAEHPQVGAK